MKHRQRCRPSAAGRHRLVELSIAWFLLLLLHSVGSAAAAVEYTTTKQNDPSSSDGIRPVPTPRIVDGLVLPDGTFPAFGKSASLNTLCGGTLIHPDILLTAAHCQGAFNQGVYFNVTAQAQAQQSNQHSNTLTGTHFRRVQQQRPHPGYIQLAFDNLIGNDVLVLSLQEPIWDIPPVPLNNDPSIPTAGQDVTALGVGLTSYKGSVANELRKITVTALSNAECTVALQEFDNVVVGDDLLCAGFPENQESICQGDSGGPLLVEDAAVNGDEGTPGLQVGLTSFTDDCGTVAPDGFARVSTFYDWIQAQICDISNYPPESCNSTTNNATDPTQETEGTVKVVVIFAHDDAPDETTWAIRSQITNQVVFAGPQYIPQPNQQWSTALFLEPGPYILQILDDAKNGLQGSARTGYFFIQTDRFTLLPVTPGVFRYKFQQSFRVPTLQEMESGILEPTAGPTPGSKQPTGPTVSPTFFPTSEDLSPTKSPEPTNIFSSLPTLVPTSTPLPSSRPSSVPSIAPSAKPTRSPSTWPSLLPSDMPSGNPSLSPTSSSAPTPVPTLTTAPTGSIPPSISPSRSMMPTMAETTVVPTLSPFTELPTIAPSDQMTSSTAAGKESSAPQVASGTDTVNAWIAASLATLIVVTWTSILY